MRTIGQIILYNKMAKIPADEDKDVTDFLESEFDRESLDYPFDAPKFNRTAAIWAAKILYSSVQLLLYRDMKPAEMLIVIPPYPGKVDASAMISADLCLRFLPQVIVQLTALDSEDPLIGLLMERLSTFHYSAIGSDIDFTTLDLQCLENKCIRQLYIDRIIDLKAENSLQSAELKKGVLESLGDHKNIFWREIELIQNNN